MTDPADAEREVARICIHRVIDSDGEDIVRVCTDDMDGGDLGPVEALGMLAVAEHHVTHLLLEHRAYEDES